MPASWPVTAKSSSVWRASVELSSLSQRQTPNRIRSKTLCKGTDRANTQVWFHLPIHTRTSPLSLTHRHTKQAFMRPGKSHQQSTALSVHSRLSFPVGCFRRCYFGGMVWFYFVLLWQKKMQKFTHTNPGMCKCSNDVPKCSICSDLIFVWKESILSKKF